MPVEILSWPPAPMSGLTRIAMVARTPLSAAIRARRSISGSDSTLISLTPTSSANASSAAVLPTPEKTMRSGRNPRRQGAPDFAFRHRIRARAEPREGADDRHIGVGLDRVGDQGRSGLEGVSKDGEVPLKGRGGIDVDGRADGLGDRSERHALAHHARAVTGGRVVEMIQASRLSAVLAQPGGVTETGGPSGLGAPSMGSRLRGVFFCSGACTSRVVFGAVSGLSGVSGVRRLRRWS